MSKRHLQKFTRGGASSEGPPDGHRWFHAGLEPAQFGPSDRRVYLFAKGNGPRPRGGPSRRRIAGPGAARQAAGDAGRDRAVERSQASLSERTPRALSPPTRAIGALAAPLARVVAADRSQRREWPEVAPDRLQAPLAVELAEVHALEHRLAAL